jgi:hypothetical protein
MVLYLKETLPSEEPKLLLVVLTGQIERDNPVPIVNPLGKQLAGLGLGQG